MLHTHLQSEKERERVNFTVHTKWRFVSGFCSQKEGSGDTIHLQVFSLTMSMFMSQGLVYIYIYIYIYIYKQSHLNSLQMP